MKCIFIPLFLSTSFLFGASSEEAFDSSLTNPPSETPLPSTNTEIAFDMSLAKPPSETELLLPTPQIQPPALKSTTLAVLLSTLLPGLGHVYLGDMPTAGGLMGSTGAGVGLIFAPVSDSVKISSLITVQNIYSYGIYAAYRDARLNNRNSGYTYSMPTDSLAALTYAPFKWSVLKKPEVWGGILGSLAVATCVSYVCWPEDAHVRASDFDDDDVSLFPALALPVGIGEETLFRGFLQSQLSESLSPWGSIAFTSLLFGAAHLPNAMALEREHRWRYYSFSIPLITSLGVYLGWLTYKNCSLQESVAMHTWYDLTLFTLGALASEAAINGGRRFAISVPF